MKETFVIQKQYPREALSMDSSKKKKGYMPQLDSIRAIAVILVIIAHWLSEGNILNRYTTNGAIGVTMFFVLSGYLITGILIRNKVAVSKNGSVREVFKNFYIRRSLRIFPIYYLVLFIALAFNIENIKENFLWHFFYCSNFYFFSAGHFQGMLSHLWSLSVEEQFYLVWPSIILFIPLKKLPAVFISGICIAILFRLLTNKGGEHFTRYLTPASLDSFCIGALLAYGQMFSGKWFILFNRYRVILLLLSAGLLFFVTPLLYKNDLIYIGFLFTIISLFSVVLIHFASVGVTMQPFSWILNNKILIYLGKISYGLYLYHNFFPNFDYFLPDIIPPFSTTLAQLLRFLSLVALATASWFFIEKPLLRLKDKYAYKASPAKA